MFKSPKNDKYYQKVVQSRMQSAKPYKNGSPISKIHSVNRNSPIYDKFRSKHPDLFETKKLGQRSPQVKNL